MRAHASIVLRHRVLTLNSQRVNESAHLKVRTTSVRASRCETRAQRAVDIDGAGTHTRPRSCRIFGGMIVIEALNR
jgi:hypothetical protein